MALAVFSQVWSHMKNLRLAGEAIYDHKANASFSLANRGPLPVTITQYASLIGSQWVKNSPPPHWLCVANLIDLCCVLVHWDCLVDLDRLPWVSGSRLMTTEAAGEHSVLLHTVA